MKSIHFIIAILFILLGQIGYGQCPASDCDITISGSSSTDYFLATGDTLCLTGAANYTGIVTLQGGVLMNCADNSQTFGITPDGGSPTSDIFNYGVIYENGSSNFDNCDLHNYGSYNDLGDWKVQVNSIINNYNNIIVNGKFDLVTTSTLNNQGSITSVGKFTNNATFNNSGGCVINTSDFDNKGVLTGVICGTITTFGVSINSGTINGSVAMVDASATTFPFVDSNTGTVAGTVTGITCGCPGSPEICGNTLDDDYDCFIDCDDTDCGVSYLVRTTTEPAEFVIGQDNFTSSTPGTTDSKFDSPSDIAQDPTTGKVFVSEMNNHRILRWESLNAFLFNEPAEAVFGQSNFTSNSPGTAANKLSQPFNIEVDASGRLWVVEQGNHRVLRFDNASTISTGASADGVLGQPNFTASGFSVTQSSLWFPRMILIDDLGTLWVTDRYRILRFDNPAAKANGANADGVLGQSNFTSNSTSSSTTITNWPDGLVKICNKLYASVGDDRIVWWNAPNSKSNGAAIDGVLCQPDFTTFTSGLSQTKVTNPYFLSTDGEGSLLASDGNNRRILVLKDVIKKSFLANFDVVIGQTNFTSAVSTVSQTGNKTLNGHGILTDGNRKYFASVDGQNNRILVRAHEKVITDETTDVSSFLPGTDPSSSGSITFAITSQPSVGSVTLDNATTGAFTYTAPGLCGVNADEILSFSYTLSNGNACAKNGEMVLKVTDTGPCLIDLSIEIESADINTPIDSSIVYSLTVSNTSASSASGVFVTSLIPTGLTYVSSNGDGTYTSGTGIWNIGTIPANEAVILNIIATVNSSGSYQIDAEITAATETDLDSDPATSFGVDDLSDSITDDDEDSVTIIPIPIDDCNDRRQYAALNITAAAVSPYPTSTWPGGFSQTFPTGTEDFTITFDNTYITGDSIIHPNWAGNGTLTYSMNDANPASNASHSGDDRVTEYHDFNPSTKPNATDNIYRVFGRGIFSFNSSPAPLAHDYDLSFDFTSLDEGYLPAGTILGFTDIDGTGLGEIITMTATTTAGPNDDWLTLFDHTVDLVDPAGLVTYDPIAHSYVLDGPATSNESVAYVTSVDLNSLNINVFNDGSSMGLKLAAPMVKAPSISFDNVTVNENAGNAVFTVSIDCTNTFDVNFDYATADVSATAGTDYTSTSGTATIAAGTTSTTISVPISEDLLDESTETFQMNFTNAVNAIFSATSKTGSITDNDATPSLTVSTTTFAETVGFASFDVDLSAVSGQDVTFWYSSTEYTAEAPADFISTLGSHLMPAGVTTWTFNVPIIDDAVYEGTEGIFTNIYTPSNATIAVPQDTMWITDNEVIPCLPHPLLHLKADVGFSPPTWTDQSPNGNDATTFGDPTSAAGSMNFNPGINFDGDDHVEVSLPELVFDEGNKHITIFAVYEPSTSSSAIGVFGNQGTNTGTIELYNNFFGVGYGSLIMSSAFGDSPHLITYVIDEEDNVSGSANSSKFYHNGDLKSSVTFNEGNSANMDSNFHIGSSGSFFSSPFFQGDIHEVMIYHENNGNVSLSDSQRQQIESYLALKYGISLSHDYTDSQ